MKRTQTEKLVWYLRDHPEATSLDITLAVGIVNVTGRVSDARASGFLIDCVRRFDGRQGYVLREQPAQLEMSLA